MRKITKGETKPEIASMNVRCCSEVVNLHLDDWARFMQPGRYVGARNMWSTYACTNRISFIINHFESIIVEVHIYSYEFKQPTLMVSSLW